MNRPAPFFFLIPLLLPVIYSRMTQDSFLFPKEIFFIASCGALYFYRCFRLYRAKEPFIVKLSAFDSFALALLFACALSIAGRAGFSPAFQPMITVIAAAFFYFELKFFNGFNYIFNKFINYFIISGFAAIVYAFFQYYRFDFLFGGSVYDDKMRLFSFFGNKNYFSEFLTALFFLIAARILILLTLNRHKRLIKCYKTALFFYFTAFIIYFVMIFILQSRASFLALAAGLIYSMYYIYGDIRLRVFFKTFRYRILFFAAAAVLCAAIFALPTPLTRERTDLSGRISSIFALHNERNIAMRFDIWRASIKMISDNFWTGCGLGYYKMNYLDYQSLLLKENSNLFYENQFFAKANQAHNELLQIFCELGFAGFLCAVFMALSSFLASRSAASFYKNEGSLRKYISVFCIYASIISILINSFFAFPFHILPTALVFIVCAAALEKLSFDKSGGGRYTYLFTAGYSLDIRKWHVLSVAASGAIIFLLLAALAPAYVKANIYMKAGLDCLKSNMTRKAFNYLEKSIAYNPFNGEARYYMGICYMNRKRYDMAIVEFLTSLETESNPNIYYNTGLAFYKIGMYDEALEYMHRALALSPHDSYYLLNAGCAYQKKKDYGRAVEYFQKALSYASTPEAVINLGHAYYLMGLYEKAAQILKTALIDYGGNRYYSERIYYILGLSFLDSKNYKSAIYNFEAARALSPGNTDYALNLGLSMIFDGKTDEAVIVFGGFLKEKFDDLIAYNLAGLYYEERRYSDALLLLERIVKNVNEKSVKSDYGFYSNFTSSDHASVSDLSPRLRSPEDALYLNASGLIKKIKERQKTGR